MSFRAIYRDLVSKIMTSQLEQLNARTNKKVRTMRGGFSFELNLNNSYLPFIDLRKVYPHIAATEVAWFLSGERDITWLKKYVKIWDNFTEDNGEIKNAYGYRWRKHFLRDQIQEAIDALTMDPSCRQVYISTWDPRIDGLMGPSEKNIPCPVGFTLSIIEDELHSSLLLRSSDVFVGLPYDVMGHAMLMKAFANSLKVTLGKLNITLAHAHIYENHWIQAEEALDRRWVGPVKNIPDILMPNAFDISGIHMNKDAFVEYYRELDFTDPNLYNPKVDIVL